MYVYMLTLSRYNNCHKFNFIKFSMHIYILRFVIIVRCKKKKEIKRELTKLFHHSNVYLNKNITLYGKC